MPVASIAANDDMVIKFCNFFHKPTGFKIKINLSADYKLSDAGNGKSKSTPAGDQ